MTRYVLDTNIVSFFVRGMAIVQTKLHAAMRDTQHHFIACPVVYYEAKRGLLKSDARKQMSIMEALFSQFEWLEYERKDWLLASELWTKRDKLGRPISETDLLIAVFTINRDATLITNNTKDFDHLGLTLEDWAV